MTTSIVPLPPNLPNDDQTSGPPESFDVNKLLELYSELELRLTRLEIEYRRRLMVQRQAYLMVVRDIEKNPPPETSE